MAGVTVTLTSDGHAEKLQSEIARMRERHALCDLIIQVSGGIEYAVHKVVMVTHSRYFRMQMDCGQLQSSKHCISTVDASMFAPLLTYFYTGQLHITSSNIWSIITAATQLDISDALNLCERYLQNTIEPGQETKDIENEGANNDNTPQFPDDQSTDKRKADEVEKEEQIRNINQQSNTNGAFPKVKLSKKKTRQAYSSDQSDNEDFPFVIPSADEADWKSNDASASRTKRKQSNPQKLVSGTKGKTKAKVSSQETRQKVTHRKWISRLMKLHNCVICKRAFPYRAMVTLHLRSHKCLNRLERKNTGFPKINRSKNEFSGNTEYSCSACSSVQKYWYFADLHRQKEHLQKYRCNQCSHSYSTKLLLYKHMAMQHTAKTHSKTSELFRCDKCMRTFKFKLTFLRHIQRLHNSGKRCLNCGRCMRQQEARDRHLIGCYRIAVKPSLNSTKIVHENGVATAIKETSSDLHCAKCDRQFKYQKAFSKHMKVCESVAREVPTTSTLEKANSFDNVARQYECRNCQELFPSLELLQKHQKLSRCSSTQLHSALQIRRRYTKRCNAWDCEVTTCGFKSSNPHALTKHVKHLHPDYLVPCNECTFTTGAKILLERHVRTKHRRALKCDQCQRTFSVPAQLRVHRYIKHKIDDGSVQVHFCSVPGCKYTCVWKSSLKVHVLRHEIEKPFSCQFCDKKFKRQQGVEKHINKVHKGIRPYMCDVCGQAYGEEAELKAHIVRHNADKQYKCQHCDYATHDKGNYQSHLFGMHRIVNSKEMIIFTCNVCDYTTDRKHRYEMHMKNHMGIRDIKCPVCDKGFVTKNTLANHIQRVHSQHVYTCTYCQYTTRNQHTYKEHVRVMHTHRDVKPYKCAYCDFRCHTSGNCRKHCANRHKGMEIKWVRLCELYSNETDNDGIDTGLVVEERPIAESNIKHISIARRISKDVLNQQQQLEKEQQQQQQQQNDEQQHDQQPPPGLSDIMLPPTFVPDPIPQQSLSFPTMQIPIQQLTFDTTPTQQQSLDPVSQQQTTSLQIPQLSGSLLGCNRNEELIQMNSIQQQVMSFGYVQHQMIPTMNPQTIEHNMNNSGIHPQKDLTLL